MADIIQGGSGMSVKFHDNGDGTYSPETFVIDPNGGLVSAAYDYIHYTNTSSTVDTYTYRSGGAAGVVVATITITYVDASKAQISSVART